MRFPSYRCVPDENSEAVFAGLYARVFEWSGRPAAWRYLAGLSFAESSFFPVPPDVMLIPMCVAKPTRAWRLAFIATLFSTLGGLLGYVIGWLAYDAIAPLLQNAGYAAHVAEAEAWFARYGVWIVLVAGFSPLPYKAFTVTAGALTMPLLPFLLASLLGRGARFYLVAAVAKWLGPHAEPWLRRYAEWLGWMLVVLTILALLWLNLR